MEASGAEVEIENLVKPEVYALAFDKGEEGELLKIVFNYRAYCDVELLGRHGFTLMIQNVFWMVIEKPIGEALPGLPILENLGLNTKVIIPDASDRLHAEIDILNLFQENEKHENAGKIARVFNICVFHSEKGVDDHSTEKEDDLLYFGEETSAENRAEMDAIIQRGGKRNLQGRHSMSS